MKNHFVWIMLLVAIFTSVTGTGNAQGRTTTMAEQLKGDIEDQVEAVRMERTTPADQRLGRIKQALQGLGVLTSAMVLGSEGRILQAIEAARVDKQIGSDGRSAGSTTLVRKGGIPKLLGLAVENGALSEQVAGTTITFTGTPAGIVDAMKGAPITSNSPFRNLAFSVSFDGARGTSNTFTGARQELSSYSFRYVFVNQRDPAGPQYKSSWDELIPREQELATRLFAIGPTLATDAEYQDWLDRTATLLEMAPDSELETILKQRYAVLADLIPRLYVTHPNLAKAAREFDDSLNRNLDGRDKILQAAAKGLLVTAEYTNYRIPNEPDQSKFTFITEGSLKGGKVDLTANGSFTILNALPAEETSRVRDFEFSGQIDVPLHNLQSIGSFVLSFAGKYQRLRESSTIRINGQDVTGLKGDVGYAQGKLTMPLAAGVKVPLSVTVANRTELIKEHDVRANIGITFDLDAIYSSIRP